MQIPQTEENPEITEVDIKVCVKDTNGDPINNANVILAKGATEYTGTTGTAGGCTLRNVTLGDYELTVNASGYVTETDNKTITDATTTINIELIQETPYTPTVYSFISYSDAEKTETWGTGTVETTGTVENGYTEVEVLTNETDESFVGEKFFIISTAKTDGTVYELFTDAGVTSAGIFVTINTE